MTYLQPAKKFLLYNLQWDCPNCNGPIHSLDIDLDQLPLVKSCECGYIYTVHNIHSLENDSAVIFLEE